MRSMDGKQRTGILFRKRGRWATVFILVFFGLAAWILPSIFQITLPGGEVPSAAPAVLAAEKPTLQDNSSHQSLTVKTESAGSDLSSPTTPRPLRDIEPAGDPVPVYLPTPVAWDGNRRVNILVLGLDYGEWDNPDRAGPSRTDTLLVLTIDPLTLEAGMLSIPRDLTVDMPGIIRPNKINTAHRFGEFYNLPGGGPGLAMRTVEDLLGVPIDYYVRIDFYAFERIIDEIGGVELDIPKEIKVDPLGPENTITLEAGLQHLDGPVALAYARARNTPGGDFDRAGRQQQVILAVRERVMKLQTLPLLVFKAPRLYRELNAGIQTNLPLEKAIRLAWLARNIELEDIQTGAIGRGQLYVETTEEGMSLFRASPDRVRVLVERIFSSPPLSPGQFPDLKERMQAETPRIFIVDGTGVEGMAKRTADYLEAQGIQVEDVFLADEAPERTSLLDYTRKTYTVQYLTRLMGLYHSDILVQQDPASPADVMIRLGKDWARNNPLP
jgi:polyisoprenyl-teichoic acid--peptidoglycan teichoic acid transferase